jgi:hypothetical protein
MGATYVIQTFTWTNSRGTPKNIGQNNRLPTRDSNLNTPPKKSSAKLIPRPYLATTAYKYFSPVTSRMKRL